MISFFYSDFQKVSGFRCQDGGTRKLNFDTSYETTPKWHGFLMIRRVAWMTRIKQRTAEYRITNIEFRRMESLREICFKIDRIHSFDVRCWTFDVRCSSVSFSIRLAAFQASGGADPPCMRYKIASVMRAGSRTKCHASMFAHHPNLIHFPFRTHNPKESFYSLTACSMHQKAGFRCINKSR